MAYGQNAPSCEPLNQFVLFQYENNLSVPVPIEVLGLFSKRYLPKSVWHVDQSLLSKISDRFHYLHELQQRG